MLSTASEVLFLHSHEIVPLYTRQNWVLGKRVPFPFVMIGYHFCEEWDGLLIGPFDMEMQCCTCYARGGHPSRLDKVRLLGRIVNKACAGTEQC
jgi:hypothetical protein